MEDLRGQLARAAETYKRALLGHEPGLTWDYLVLTAANEHQAAGYRHELKVRSEGSGAMGAFFPSSQQSIVVPDPPGFRAGSGGATFGVLRALAAHQEAIGDKKPFEALRILVIHSGGASQRLPQFSPLGKIFMPLPLVRPDGELMTLFDQTYLMLAGLPARVGAGMLVAAGDVMLMFEAGGMPRPPAGVTALSMRVGAEMGEAHGVFLVEAQRHGGTEAQRGGEKFLPVRGTMQKATVAEMGAAGARDAGGRVLIDSGLLWFDAAATTALHALTEKYSAGWHKKTGRQIDLYTDIVPAAMGDGAGAVDALREDLRGVLRESPLWVYELPEAHFMHLGTTRQFRDALVGKDASPAARMFGQNVRFASAAGVPGSARVYQSVIDTSAVKLGEETVVENCVLRGAMKLGCGSVLSGVSFGAGERAEIPAGMLVFQVPIQDRGRRMVTVMCGIGDDFKSAGMLCNMELGKWLKCAGVSEKELWAKGAARRTLWTAKLFGEQKSLAGVLWMARPGKLGKKERAAWRRGRRWSMAEILERADAGAMARHRDGISGMLQAIDWIAAVRGGTNASVQDAVNHFSAAGYQALLDRMDEEVERGGLPLLTTARLVWNQAEIRGRPHFPKGVRTARTMAVLQRTAFECISAAMTPKQEVGGGRARICAEGELTASAPVRIDLTGGWTDTPPHCLECGGAVVNVALDLNGAEPIQTVFRPLEKPVVRLISRDLGKTMVVTDPDQLRKEIVPGDPFALQIVALRLAGLAPVKGEKTVRKWLARVSGAGRGGRGFELVTMSNLPKGSGMGTSSILGATTVAVLRAATGQDTAEATLFEQTLLLEQHLGTGGGWQDQVGGIVGGVKITETGPGIPQVLKVRKIALGDAELKQFEERLVVHFTGQQRLARNILREVMGRYLSREAGTMALFAELRQSALACEAAIRKGDWEGCAAEINRYWRIKRDLFPGSTTPAVDTLFAELRRFYLGAGLAGAGGGGFAYFLCADAEQARRLREELRTISMRPGNLALVFAARINRAGLRVNVGGIVPALRA